MIPHTVFFASLPFAFLGGGVSRLRGGCRVAVHSLGGVLAPGTLIIVDNLYEVLLAREILHVWSLGIVWALSGGVGPRVVER